MDRFESLLNRLEAATARLEKCGGAGAEKKGEEAQVDPAVIAYDEFVKAAVTPLVGATKALKIEEMVCRSFFLFFLLYSYLLAVCVGSTG